MHLKFSILNSKSSFSSSMDNFSVERRCGERNALKPSYKWRGGKQEFGGISGIRGNNLLSGMVMSVQHKCVVDPAPLTLGGRDGLRSRANFPTQHSAGRGGMNG